MTQRSLFIASPLTGLVVPLAQLPDRVLAHGLAGDGVAVDPTTNTLIAPFDGIITGLHAPAMTLTLRSDDGLELQIKLGTSPTPACTTGFSTRVIVEQRVKSGEVMAQFDADLLARHGSSLLSAVLVTAAPAGWRLARLIPASGLVNAGASTLLTIELETAGPAPGRVDLLAPLSGIMTPLEDVPDAVFAQRLVGDGVSIDPSDTELCAPTAGKVTLLHASRHALTLTTPEGLEVLLHIGIDTVKLRGKGFQALVAEGEHVVAGQPLIRFDPDLVARGSTSLLTQMLIANGDRVTSLQPRSGRVQAGRDVACAVMLTAAPLAGHVSIEAHIEVVRTANVVLRNPAGLHARPAAMLAAAAKKFSCDLQLVRQADHERPSASANARSVVAIMSLGTRFGDNVAVTACGADASIAAAAIVKLLTDGCGENLNTSPPTAVVKSHGEKNGITPPVRANQENGLLHGVSASPGLAVGKIHRLRKATITVTERGGDPVHERSTFAEALAFVTENLTTQAEQDRDTARREILVAHRELLDDPDLHAFTLEAISSGKSAAFAWQGAIGRQAAVLERLDNPLLRERVTDLRDVGRQVLIRLAGVDDHPSAIPPGSILIAEELTPSDTIRFEPGSVLGFCTTTGGATSHVAILARSLGLPAICGIDEATLALADGTTVLLDGDAGILDPAPSAETLSLAESRRAAWLAQNALNRAAAHQPAITMDGVRIEVAANVTSAAEAQEGVVTGADGVGLLRSEFLFDHRDTAPDEEEQAAVYTAVARALGPERTLVVRTLDVGGDKPLSYLPLPREDNPFLGMRGLRVSLERRDLFRVQLRAILRASGLARLHVMFPMVTSVDELRAARALVEEERTALGVPPIQIGVMIEVPAAALLAEHLAREADFFSIGTNDLTQYVLAMDRGHPRLAKQADALHPAVLHAIRLTCEGAHAHGSWVGVCGGLAADELAVPALIGLGVDELSVPVPAIPAIKAAIARCDRRRCNALAVELLALSTPQDVRAHLSAAALKT